MQRRTFLAALAALPFVGRFARLRPTTHVTTPVQPDPRRYIECWGVQIPKGATIKSATVTLPPDSTLTLPPDLENVIQEIVNRGDWKAGKTLRIPVTDSAWTPDCRQTRNKRQ